MAGFYGNTVISTGGAIESHTHFKADHTFDAMFSGMGQTFASKGTWELKDGNVCRTYDPAPPGIYQSDLRSGRNAQGRRQVDGHHQRAGAAGVARGRHPITKEETTCAMF